MNAFSFYNPVKLIFGKDQLAKLTNELSPYGKKVSCRIWRRKY